jgi:hypothetical protein
MIEQKNHYYIPGRILRGEQSDEDLGCYKKR